MDRTRLNERLMATFVVELEGSVHSLEQSLLALEKGQDQAEATATLSSLLRTAHSLKGAAQSMTLPLIETASHHLEEVLTRARDQRIGTDGDFFEILLSATDAMKEAAQRLRAGTALDDAPLVAASQHLIELHTGRRSGAPVSRPHDPAKSTGQTNAAPVVPSPSPPTRSPPEPVIKTAPEPVPPIPDAPARGVATRQASNMVRVSSEKLDQMLRQAGEFLTVKHRTDIRREDAIKLQEIVTEWRKGWRELEHGIAGLMEQRGPAPAAMNGAEGATAPRTSLDQSVNRARDSLSRLERGLQKLSADLAVDRRAIDQAAGPLDTAIREARMSPFAEACEGLDRVVRDLGKSIGKEAELSISGADVGLDRLILDGIKAPLMHLIRNALDHGIEAPDRRRAAGKPAAGQISIAAAIRGSRIQVTIADDGRGLDIATIRQRLLATGRPVPDNERDLVRSIFQPGFSTSLTVNEVSGRGVGLDVVETQISALRGTVDVDFEPGRGTRFTLSVPLTLSSIHALLVEAGGRTYAIDTANMIRVVRIGPDDIVAAGAREMMLFSDHPVPLLSLAEVLGLPLHPVTEAQRAPAIVLTAGGREIGLIVESVVAEREVVVRALGPRLTRCPNISGATILPNGRIALILSADDLVNRGSALDRSGSIKDMSAATGPDEVKKRLLVVDDSATIRMMEKSILEAAGYQVTVATDGQDAWHLLLEAGADLVVSDVEMPRMDGFSLTEAIRGSSRFRDLPVILVTGLESDADKARGMAVGANAYRPKSAFDQHDLLATIERML